MRDNHSSTSHSFSFSWIHKKVRRKADFSSSFHKICEYFFGIVDILVEKVFLFLGKRFYAVHADSRFKHFQHEQFMFHRRWYFQTIKFENYVLFDKHCKSRNFYRLLTEIESIAFQFQLQAAYVMERIAFASGKMYAAKLCIEYKVNFLPSNKVECNQSVDFYANVFHCSYLTQSLY